MLPLLIAATQIAYQFPAGTHRLYDIKVAFDGYLPIFGGREAKAELTMLVDVVGQAPDEKGNQRSQSEIKELKLMFNGAQMPFSAVNIQAYFPKTTISLTPQGKVLKTDAPGTPFPFRLPGLDVKKFPDITYLPLEFPEAGIELDKAWTFVKTFNKADMTYTVTPKAIDDKKAELNVDLAQKYQNLEDAQGSPVEDEANAVYKIESVLKGDGKATFDRELGLIEKFEGNAETVSQATEIKTGKVVPRKLKTTILAKLRRATS